MPSFVLTDTTSPHTTARENLLHRIVVNNEVCHGKPCIRGHRIPTSLVLGFLASGTTAAEILANYPGLEHEDILACIAYGAEISRERFVDLEDIR